MTQATWIQTQQRFRMGGKSQADPSRMQGRAHARDLLVPELGGQNTGLGCASCISRDPLEGRVVCSINESGNIGRVAPSVSLSRGTSWRSGSGPGHLQHQHERERPVVRKRRAPHGAEVGYMWLVFVLLGHVRITRHLPDMFFQKVFASGLVPVSAAVVGFSTFAGVQQGE